MPFGGESTWDNGHETKTDRVSIVTNAFRRGVHLGPAHCYEKVDENCCRHQCLSAGSPLGT